MRKIHATLETGFCGAFYEDDFEFDDDATEEEIDTAIIEWELDIKSEMSANWEEIEEEED